MTILGQRTTKGGGVRSLVRRSVRRLPDGVQGELRKGLGRLRAIRSSFKPYKLTLSIIVPVYNVEDYVASALESLIAQSLTDWEAIVVNDGSSDRSASIVETYVARDDRIRVIHQNNEGLGAARNTGIRQASGTYLTFLDSDDLIPPGAYETAVKTLQKSGSDFAIGAIQRIRGSNRFSPHWSKQVHAHQRLRTTLDYFPDVMMDIIACNRVVKTTFWREQIGEFPTGVAYEDHRVMLAALVRASSFDVLSTITYLWRVRPDEGSISQRKKELQNIIHRKSAHDDGYAVLREEASEVALSAWLTRGLDTDVPLFAEHAVAADDEYRGVAQQFAQKYVELADAKVWANVRWHQRIKTILMASGRWEELEQFVIDLRGRTGVPGTVTERGTVRLDMRRWHEPIGGLLQDRDVLGERHTRLFARIDHQEWKNDGLCLSGFAYIAHVAPDECAELELKLVNQRTGMTMAVPLVDSVRNDYVNRFANHQYFDYSRSGFKVILEWEWLLSLFGSNHGAPDDSWELRASMTWHGISRTAAVDTTRRGGAAGALRSELRPEYSIYPVPHRVNGALHIEARYVHAALEDIHTDGARVAGLITVPPHEGRTPVEIGSSTNSVPLLRASENWDSATDWTPYTFDGFLPGLKEPDRMQVRFTDGTKCNLAWNVASVDLSNLAPYAARRSPFGYVDILHASQRYIARDVTHTPNALTIYVDSGQDEAGQTPHFTLHSTATNATLDPSKVEEQANGVTAVTFDFNRRGENGKSLQGSYHLRAGEAPIVPSEEVIRALPHTLSTESYRVELLRASASQKRALKITLGPPLRDDEQGAWAQSQLKEWFINEEFDSLHAVLFQCYRGETAGDSQWAIHEELVRRGTDLTLYWGVEDGTVNIPSQGIRVIIGSRRWYELLGSVEYLCNNIDFDRFFYRRNHQRFLQTFHGHPFKAMGKSFWKMTGHGPRSIQHEMHRRQQLWTSAVMPNDESIDYYQAEYGFEDSYLVTGYPRNDEIVNGSIRTARERLATELNIPCDESKWVLYAPTWRENAATGTWSALMVDELDLMALSNALGEGWTILVRGHYHNAREHARTMRQASIIDVTDYPEINDLILAGDVAILDYSSLRFDWAITRKPIIFFVPDKAEYLTSRPGLFRYDESAPGRQVVTTESVANAVLESDQYEREYGKELDTFNERFNPLSDGRAAERLVDAFFDPKHA